MSKLIPAQQYCVKVFDGTHDTPKPVSTGHPLITSKNILGRKLNLQDTYNISQTDYLSVQKRSAVSKWDILFSMIGSIGETYLEKNDNIPYAIKNVGVFSCNDEYKSKWLYYYLISPYAKTFINNYLAGAVQKFLGLGTLREFPIIPYDESKKKKVDLLYAIDSKIELNNKINAELEAMVKTLYNYWFVQFDFPNKNSKPYKSSGGEMAWSEELKKDIPKGWEVKKISDLLPVTTGRQDANFATENGKYNFFTCGEEILKCDKYEFEGKAVLIAGNGNFNIKLYEGKFNAYQRTYILIPDDKRHYTLIYMAVKDRIDSFRKGSRGSIVKFITKGDIENIQIPLPKDYNLDLYSSLNTITEKIERNILENQTLTSLRDWLLPMLMNGQVTVK